MGVPVIEYAPYYFFGFLSPLVLVFMGATGWKIFYQEGADPEASGEGQTPSPSPAE
jgi:NhaC family Na+:H+ antiporter